MCFVVVWYQSILSILSLPFTVPSPELRHSYDSLRVNDLKRNAILNTWHESISIWWLQKCTTKLYTYIMRYTGKSKETQSRLANSTGPAGRMPSHVKHQMCSINFFPIHPGVTYIRYIRHALLIYNGQSVSQVEHHNVRVYKRTTSVIFTTDWCILGSNCEKCRPLVFVKRFDFIVTIYRNVSVCVISYIVW